MTMMLGGPVVQAIQARYYQDEAADCLFPYFEENAVGNPLIVLPTASGKSIVIPLFLRKVFDRYPLANMRSLIIVPSKELVKQNAKKMRAMLPNVSLGINCDGLKKRDTWQNNVIGTPGSIVSMVKEIGHIDLILVDEAHTIPEKEAAVINLIIAGLKAINPNLRMIGLTATPFDNYGLIVRHDPKTGECTSLFTHIPYTRIAPEDFLEFIHKGWLCPLIAVGTTTKYDVSSVGMSRGDFNQRELQDCTDKEWITRLAVSEIIATFHAKNRHCGLVFANGIQHAEHVCEEMQAQGMTATVIHSKLKDDVRNERLEAYHRGEYDFMVNNGVLTIGYDHPPVDLIAVIRHTCSIPLWVQILGRGLRPYDWNNPEQYIPGFEYTKSETIVMDFADNTSRLGPIDNPFFKKRSKGDSGDAPVKICPVSHCQAYNYASARYCYNCDHEFKFEVKYTGQSSGDSPLSNTEPVRDWVNVQYVNYTKVTGSGGLNMMKVIYHAGSKTYSELVCLEHTTGAARHARAWWIQRTEMLMPSRVDDALKITSKLRWAKRIEVEVTPGAKYPKVISHEF